MDNVTRSLDFTARICLMIWPDVLTPARSIMIMSLFDECSQFYIINDTIQDILSYHGRPIKTHRDRWISCCCNKYLIIIIAKNISLVYIIARYRKGSNLIHLIYHWRFNSWQGKTLSFRYLNNHITTLLDIWMLVLNAHLLSYCVFAQLYSRAKFKYNNNTNNNISMA